jgi:hypothetical protein
MIAHTELACIYHGQHQIIQATLSEPLPIKNGFHWGDALACLLFNTDSTTKGYQRHKN